MPYEVNFTDEFGEWWERLTVSQQEDITARAELLEELGPTLGRPVVDRVKTSAFHNMKELRCSSGGALRVLCLSVGTSPVTGMPGTTGRSRRPTSCTRDTSGRCARKGASNEGEEVRRATRRPLRAES